MPDAFKPLNALHLKLGACISFMSVVMFLFTYQFSLYFPSPRNKPDSVKIYMIMVVS